MRSILIAGIILSLTALSACNRNQSPDNQAPSPTPSPSADINHAPDAEASYKDIN